MQPLTDDILWDSFCQGNKEALATLFERHYANLYRYASKLQASRELANDLIQDLFIEIWHQRTPKPILSVKAYLLQSIRYKVIRAVRQAERFEQILDAGEAFEICAEDFLIQQEQDETLAKKLAAALDALSPRQREVVYLRFYLGMSYREICEILTLEYQIARNHLHAALKRLRVQLVSASAYSWMNLTDR